MPEDAGFAPIAVASAVTGTVGVWVHGAFFALFIVI